ncbi:MAG TPA: VWA domain-containing protein [Candidatus Binatia bacterium]
MKDRTSQFSAPSDNDHVFAFGAEAAKVSSWREIFDGDQTAIGISPEKTNLENLFNALLKLPPAPRNLYLFSDGWETQGDVGRLLPTVAAAGIKVYPILPAERAAIANVAVTKLLAPTQGNSSESLNLKVIVENQSDRVVEGTLTLTGNGKTVKKEAVRLNPGSQAFTYQATPTEGELTAYQAAFAPRDRNADLYPSDNHALALVSVRTKAKVLLITGRSGAGEHLQEIFKRHGLETTVRTPENAPPPKDYKVVIFNNAEREKFPAGYLASTERHVAAGNGFIMLGADQSFAPASYRQTPIEKILPVEPKEPPRPEEKNRALVLVIDKSGSMRDDNRIVFAKEAAKAVARQLKDIDLLGIVGFDDSAFVVVYLENMARLRGVVNSQIDRLKPGGQTYFLPALLEAKRQLERANASRKHIMLLSDGVTRGSQGELVDLVSTMRGDSKITTSAIAISNEADVRIMKRIAQYGGGLFHHVVDPSTLPQIVLEQLQDKPKEEPPKDENLTPIQERGSELLSGFGPRTYPSIRGYMETELKRGAQLDLLITKQNRRVPLLASWHYGKGNVVAFTTDMEGRWSRNWIQWSGLQGFWGRIVDWLSPPEENLVPAHEASISLAENRSILDLFIYDESSALSQYRFTITGKSGKGNGTLTKLAPGHYQTALPISEPGEYRVDIVEERRGQKISFPPIGYNLPYDTTAERPRPDFNMRLLSRIADATGGEINPDPQAAEADKGDMVTKNYEPLKGPLIILAIGLFLLEVCLRKFIFSEP